MNGYPTIKYFPAGDKSGQDYNGGRAIEDFVKFINEKAGTERTSTGGFLETAGRIPELDELAAKFVKNSDERATILKSVDDTIAAVASNKNADLAKFYKITMGRIIAKGIGYVDEEEARLKRMLESGAVAPDKVGEFAKRANIVRQFKS